MIAPEQLVGEEWAEWYRLTPVQRWIESEKLWQIYLSLGGSLDPEPDTPSPFFDARYPRHLLRHPRQRRKLGAAAACARRTAGGTHRRSALSFKVSPARSRPSLSL